MSRVAIVSPSAGGVGGVERFADMLSVALAEMGVEAEIFVPQSHTARWWYKIGLAPLREAYSLRHRLAAFRPDLVITNGTHGFLGHISPTRVHVYHGTMPAHSMVDRGYKKVRDWLFRGVIAGGLSEFLSGIGAIRVAVSQSAASEVRRFYRLTVASVINNGVRIPELRPATRSGVIFVGRRENRKGYETAIRLASEFGERLIVAGPGSDPRTVDLGVLNEAALRELYSHAKLMLFPSQYEACSYVILEALSSGCPVVTTAVGWVPVLVSAVPEYGVLVSHPRDSEGIRQSMALAMGGDPGVTSGVQGAIQYVRKHNSSEAFADNWKNFLEPILARSERRHST